MKKIVILSGAGMSAESGIQTFRGSNGLWNGYNIYDVASPVGWAKDYKQVLDFYNLRRKDIQQAQPNEGHLVLAALENKADVTIITQNIDDLHERAGSKHICHLHGEITKARSTRNPDLIYHIQYNDINPGDTCELGSQLRPHIVWFGESVPMMDTAEKIIADANIVIVVGTSLQVYPAAGLIHSAPHSASVFLIDPFPPDSVPHNVKVIQNTAAKGLPLLIEDLEL